MYVAVSSSIPLLVEAETALRNASVLLLMAPFEGLALVIVSGSSNVV
jgi:hypothetical protein